VAIYTAADAVPELLRGTLLLPTRRFAYGAAAPESPLEAGPAVGAAMLLLAGSWLTDRRLFALHQGVVLVGLAAALKWADQQREVHDLIWNSLAQATPLCIVILALLLAWPKSAEVQSPKRQSRWMLVALAAAFGNLIQYPFAGHVYFCFIAPLLLLALIPVAQNLPGRKQPALAATVVTYLIFGALYLEPFRLAGLAGPLTPQRLAVLDLPRGGLRIGWRQAEEYEELVAVLRAHATSGVVFAGPDAPEVYFLAQLRNPTPAIFDFLVPDTLFHRHVVENLERAGVSAVALKGGFIHSPSLEPEVVAAFERRFPTAVQVGRFTVRWAP
jgi:hypothetical protein